MPLPDDTPLPVLFAWAAATAEALLRDGLQAGAVVRPRELYEARVTPGPDAVPPSVPPSLQAPARFVDRAGVNVHDGADLAAAVRFVCPGHKADSDSALAFAAECAALLYEGVGLVVVDTLPGLPTWATHLHSLAPVYPAARRPPSKPRSVLVVRPTVRSGAAAFDVWHFPLEVGQSLPTVPLPVRGPMPPLDLEATYAAAVARTPTE